MSSDIKCLRCGSEMLCAGVEKIQLGQTGWWLGDLPNLIAGAMEVQIYYCPKCRKVEFFAADSRFDEDDNDKTLPQKQCEKCGRYHDFDYPKCPYCGNKNI